MWGKKQKLSFLNIEQGNINIEMFYFINFINKFRYRGFFIVNVYFKFGVQRWRIYFIFLK